MRTLGTTIKATPNYSSRSFTIRMQDENGKTYEKFRTIPLSQEEFDSCEHHTQADWRQWMKSDDYYQVK